MRIDRTTRTRATPARTVALLALGALGLVACGGGEPAAPPEPSELEQRAAKPDGEALELRPIDPATVGRVHGRVRFEGEHEPREIPLVRECRVTGEPLFDETVVVGADGGLRDVLVHVRRGLAAWEIPPPASDGDVRLDQHGCAYVPHVVALRAGRTLRISNSDPLAHNVRVRAPRNGLDRNSTQGRGADDLLLPFERPELGVRIGCDLHPWMGAYVHALDHPFFALTEADGSFALEGLPPGDYEIEARHPELGRRRAEVTVPARGDAQLEFVFEPEDR